MKKSNHHSANCAGKKTRSDCVAERSFEEELSCCLCGPVVLSSQRQHCLRMPSSTFFSQNMFVIPCLLCTSPSDSLPRHPRLNALSSSSLPSCCFPSVPMDCHTLAMPFSYRAKHSTSCLPCPGCPRPAQRVTSHAYLSSFLSSPTHSAPASLPPPLPPIFHLVCHIPPHSLPHSLHPQDGPDRHEAIDSPKEEYSVQLIQLFIIDILLATPCAMSAPDIAQHTRRQTAEFT